MRTCTHHSLLALSFLALSATVLMLGCNAAAERGDNRPKDKDKAKPAVKDELVTSDETAKPAGESKKVPIGKNVFLEVLPDKKRRVLISAEVCLREGQLEQLLCRKGTKEHEAILTADVDARKIHAALLAAGAEAGSPVRFVPEYRSAFGTKVKVSVQYQDKDKQAIVSAQSWIKNGKDNKLLQSDWVFAGSRFVTNPLDPKGPKHYLANDGDVICVSNFETAMLDLPIKSPKDDADRVFIANTDRILPLETKVVVILEPVVEAKKDKK